ncbi:hypothetical protein CAOG_00312 [Capsaspora owczarzaki ATCC 30864]|uniref:Conserved oligomeric Golgi complex subunit 1 n=1 Tax=Capsaspora owczarzaki (strain ATCC 30864) TaxID=595528 RepID=A0A0D2VG04_CAPO3|nr:hypothetical protein CAOG_00312 [Capsaspora owczarzaki ATCC 30864]KJE88717.1 hypothetical protein CAOG_000312 [Capsaspora owczarzaki ATCC 30864]|eukprot:XP_004365183.1 hypothetical protein CAOG_00312 [Capsaspora owczarzaki ATCC 30864]
MLGRSAALSSEPTTAPHTSSSSTAAAMIARVAGATSETDRSVAAAEREAEELLIKHSVKDVLSTEQKLRGDIEHKKVELRTMVGERYRDLIDAADSILAMKQGSNLVTHSLQRLQTLCLHASARPQPQPQPQPVGGANAIISNAAASSTSTSSSNPLATSVNAHANAVAVSAGLSRHSRESGVHGKGAADVATASPKALFLMASQMRLLVDAPEHIWSALEAHEHLRAANLFLTATQAHADFTADAQKRTLAENFPILRQQWTAISHFREQILTGARRQLCITSSSTAAPAPATARESGLEDALQTLIVLDHKTPLQVLGELLEWRRRSLLRCFALDADTVHDVPERFTHMVLIVKRTIASVHACFISPDAPFPVPLDQLQRATASWFGQCCEHFAAVQSGASFTAHGLADGSRAAGDVKVPHGTVATEMPDTPAGDHVLLFVHSLRTLGSVVDRVLAALSDFPASVVAAAIGRACSVWDELVVPSLVARATQLLRGSLDQATAQLRAQCDSAFASVTAFHHQQQARQSAKITRSTSMFDNLIAIESSPSVSQIVASLDKALAAAVTDASVLCTAIHTQLGKLPDIAQSTAAAAPASVPTAIAAIFQDLLFCALARFSEELTTRVKAVQAIGGQKHPEGDAASPAAISPGQLSAETADQLLFLGKLTQTVLLGSTQISSFFSAQFAAQRLGVVSTPGLAPGMLSAHSNTTVQPRGAVPSALSRLPTAHNTNSPQPLLDFSSPYVPPNTEARLVVLYFAYRSTYLHAYLAWVDWVAHTIAAGFEANLLAFPWVDAMTDVIGATAGATSQSVLPSIALSARLGWDNVAVHEGDSTAASSAPSANDSLNTSLSAHASIAVPTCASSVMYNMLFDLCREIERAGGHRIDTEVLLWLTRAVSHQVVERLSHLLASNRITLKPMPVVTSTGTTASSAGPASVVLGQDGAIQLLFDVQFGIKRLLEEARGATKTLTALASAAAVVAGSATAVLSAHAPALANAGNSHQLQQQQHERASQVATSLQLLVSPFSNPAQVLSKDIGFTRACDEVLRRLEELVDPFDFAVLSPLLQTNVDACVHKSSLLFGALVLLAQTNAGPGPIKKPSAALPSSSFEAHSILPVSSFSGRFSLLPVVETRRKQTAAMAAQPRRLKA